MKALALVEAADHPSYRYRIEAFAWALAERGVYVTAMSFGRGAGRLRAIRAAGRFDVVILQRKLLPIWQLLLLRRNARRLIYDFDDALFHRDSYSRKGPESWSRTARFWATVYSADAVLAGNDHLAEAAAAYAPAERVQVVPTCIDPRRYRPAPHERRGTAARLVWIGQSSTLPSLEAARRQMAAAAERVPGLQLRLICDRGIKLDPLRVETRRWSSATEAEDLAAGDIGVTWLPDDSWSPGKCGLRVLQFMAAGLPVVANRVGMNRRMVVDGETGFLADTPREWAEVVGRLADDPQLRRRMGAAGRRLVEQQYGVEIWGRRFSDVLAGVGDCGAGTNQGVVANPSRCAVRESGRVSSNITPPRASACG